MSNQKYLISYCTVELPDTTWYSHVFANHIEVSKVSCLQWHVSSIELNMQLRDILNHLKPTAEAAASTSVFVHLILGQNTYMCFTTLGALPKHFFGFDIPSRSGQTQLSNLTRDYRWKQPILTDSTKHIIPLPHRASIAAGADHYFVRRAAPLVPYPTACPLPKVDMSPDQQARLLNIYLRPWTLACDEATLHVPHIQALDMPISERQKKSSHRCVGKTSVGHRSHNAAWKDYIY